MALVLAAAIVGIAPAALLLLGLRSVYVIAMLGAVLLGMLVPAALVVAQSRRKRR